MGAAAHPCQAAPARTFALVELAGMVIGVPAESVLRVLLRPAALTCLPRSHGAIDGVFHDQGQLVAVVDLDKWMARAPQAQAVPGHVMLLEVDGRTIGLAVHAVRGLVRLGAAQVSRIHHTEQEDGFFHSVGTRDDGSVVALLDAARLVEQVGAWAPHVGAAIDSGAAPDAPVTHDGAIQALVRIGETVLGFPATMVGEIVTHLAIAPLAFGAGQVRGTARWRGRLTPVVDPARTVLAAPGGQAFMVVLAHGALTLAVPVDEVLAVRTFQAAQVQDSATAGLDSTVYHGYAVEESGRRILLVDGPALLARYAVLGLDQAEAQQQTRPRARTGVPVHVVYDVGQLWAAPMHALREIVALPGDYVASTGLSDGVDGQCQWRGRMLPVIDLRPPDTRAAIADARLMVAFHGAREVGLLVNEVVALLPANTGERLRFTMPGGQAMHMITVGPASARKSYQVLDVAALPGLAA